MKNLILLLVMFLYMIQLISAQETSVKVETVISLQPEMVIAQKINEIAAKNAVHKMLPPDLIIQSTRTDGQEELLAWNMKVIYTNDLVSKLIKSLPDKSVETVEFTYDNNQRIRSVKKFTTLAGVQSFVRMTTINYNSSGRCIKVATSSGSYLLSGDSLRVLARGSDIYSLAEYKVISGTWKLMHVKDNITYDTRGNILSYQEENFNTAGMSQGRFFFSDVKFWGEGQFAANANSFFKSLDPAMPENPMEVVELNAMSLLNVIEPGQLYPVAYSKYAVDNLGGIAKNMVEQRMINESRSRYLKTTTVSRTGNQNSKIAEEVFFVDERNRITDIMKNIALGEMQIKENIRYHSNGWVSAFTKSGNSNSEWHNHNYHINANSDIIVEDETRLKEIVTYLKTKFGNKETEKSIHTKFYYKIKGPEHITPPVVTAKLWAFPNPTKDLVFISVPEEDLKAGIKMNLFDQNGMQVTTAKTENAGGKIIISLGSLPDGYYFAVIVSPLHTYYVKLVKVS